MQRCYLSGISAMTASHTNKTSVLIFIVILLLQSGTAYGWYDQTHLAVAKAAGYYKWYNTAAPDVARIKAGNLESYNHFFNNPESLDVTLEMVFTQAARYDDPKDRAGHLYGAIIASLRKYLKYSKQGGYAEAHMAYCAHYIGDLSQPLHHIPFDLFNRKHHSANDGIVNRDVLRNLDKIKKQMHPVTLRPDTFEQDLAKEISRIANQARNLAAKLKKQDRDMSKEEAYRQLGQSASLLRAILKQLDMLD